MRWLALALLLANAALWYGPTRFSSERSPGSAIVGGLPRVASLKATSPSASDNSGPDFRPPYFDSSSERRCATVGWFASREAAEAIVEPEGVLSPMSYQVVKRKQEREPLHWVIVPPQPEHAALEQLEELRVKGVDSYLVRQGEHRNAISLGLFESREAAKRLLDEKKRHNLNVILAKFSRNQLRYALSFEASPELMKELVGVAKAEHGKNFDFIKINTCKGVATPVKTP